MSQYALMIIGSHAVEAAVEGSNAAAEFAEYDREMREAGVKAHGAPFHPASAARHVSVRDGSPSTAVGELDDADEYLGGYVVLDVPDLDTALDWAARCPGAKYGRVEVRELFVM